MSKIGKKPIPIPTGVKVAIDENKITVSGEKGELAIPVLAHLKVIIENGEFKIVLTKDTKQARSNWGTMRSLVANAILGLTKEFEKTLILEGVGFRIAKDGKGLSLNIGFSHPVKYPEHHGITFELEGNNLLRIKGIDKVTVGQVAAEIRALKKPEPYKGKGFRYKDEIIRRKAGKKAAISAQ